MEPTTLSSREETYDVIAADGSHYIARGRLQLIGDFVVIGKSMVFHRPISVVPR